LSGEKKWFRRECASRIFPIVCARGGKLGPTVQRDASGKEKDFGKATIILEEPTDTTFNSLSKEELRNLTGRVDERKRRASQRKKVYGPG